MISSVNTVALSNPPTIGAAIRCMTWEPDSNTFPIITGSNPMIVVATVINFGRTRRTAPSMMPS